MQILLLLITDTYRLLMFLKNNLHNSCIESYFWQVNMYVSKYDLVFMRNNCLRNNRFFSFSVNYTWHSSRLNIFTLHADTAQNTNQLYIHNEKKHTLVRLLSIHIHKTLCFPVNVWSNSKSVRLFSPTEITLVNILWWHYLTRKLLRFQKSTEVLLRSTEVATEKY